MDKIYNVELRITSKSPEMIYLILGQCTGLIAKERDKDRDEAISLHLLSEEGFELRVTPEAVPTKIDREDADEFLHYLQQEEDSQRAANEQYDP